MKIISKALLVFAVVSFLIVVFILTIYFREKHLIDPLERDLPKVVQDISQNSELDSIASYVRYYDEVLTMSARNYALTNDIKWKVRYEEAAPKLDEKIKTAINNGDEEDKKIFDSINVANLALVKMEEESMAKTLAGQKVEAIAILDSSEYANQKQIYQEGLEKYFQSRGKKLDEVLTVSTELINTDIAHAQVATKENAWIIFGLLIFMIVIMVVLYYYIKIYLIGSLMEFNKAAKEIAAGNLNKKIKIRSNDETGELAQSFNKMIQNLKESRDSTETKIKERTVQLEKSNDVFVGRELKMIELKKEIIALKKELGPKKTAKERKNDI